MHRAFRGGDTHGNRYYCSDEDNNIILCNVHSYDRSSSYPDVICNCLFPVTPFKEVCGLSENDFPLLFSRGRALLMDVKLKNVKLRDRFFGDPYLSRDKSREIENGRFFNGRILSADSLIVSITDVDYRIIKEVYSFDMEILTAYKSNYGPLPQPFVDTVIDYYRKKTELKGKTDEFSAQLYLKSKNKLNSCYGMMAMSVCREVIEYHAENLDDPEKDVFTYGDITDEEKLEKSRAGYWLPYEWGVWVTAWARFRLYEGIKLVSAGMHKSGAQFSDFVYADTDSVKYIGSVDWTKYNALREEDSKRSGAYAVDAKGKTHYMGVYEPETDPEGYEQFKTLGAKKYAYVDHGKLHITIAGVAKKKGAEELKRAGGLKALKDGFVFREAGGLEAYYNDCPQIKEYHIDGHSIRITSNLYLKPGEYTVGTLGVIKRICNLNKSDIDKILQNLYNTNIPD